MKIEIKIEHIYQDINCPHYQRVQINADYATLYAFFNALIETAKNFEVKIVKTQKLE